MAKKIHFQDDLYQIARTIDILYEGLKLDLDNEFFSEYYLSQILFLDNTITEIFNFLDENKQLIERKIQVRNLYSIEKKFILFLESINPETGIMESISQGNNKIRQVIESHKDKIPYSQSLKLQASPDCHAHTSCGLLLLTRQLALTQPCD